MSHPTSFDPNAFLDAQQTEVNEKRPPLPEENPADSNGLYTAVIGEIKMSSGIIEKGDNAGKPWLSASIPLQIEVPASLRSAMGLPPKITITDRAFIDLTPQGTIDNGKGKNARQRIYREALGLNKPGDVWSWRKAVGQPVKVKIKHELYNDQIQERINSVLGL